MDAKTGMIEVKKTSLYSKKRREIIQISAFETSPMYVSLKLGRTIAQPYGNYAKAEVTISMPCYVEEMEEVYAEIKDKVVKLLEEQVEIIDDESRRIEERINHI